MSDEPQDLELSENFTRASQLRVPLWDRAGEKSTMVLSEELAEYMLLSAWYAGALHEERLTLYQAHRKMQSEWDHLEGWETFQRGKTDSSREDAKRIIRPDLYDEIQQSKWMIARLSEEIDRLNRDAEKAVSRTYTILTGT